MIIEIMFSDLKEKKQRELLKAYQVDSPDAMNWHDIPLTVIEAMIGEEPQPVVQEAE